MPFFQLNWIVVFVTLLFLMSFIVLEHQFKFVSEVLGIKAYKLYLLTVLIGSLAAFLNYIAIKVFGSWEMLVMFIVISVVLILVFAFMIRRKIKSHREKKELQAFRKEKEARTEANKDDFSEEVTLEESNAE